LGIRIPHRAYVEGESQKCQGTGTLSGETDIPTAPNSDPVSLSPKGEVQCIRHPDVRLDFPFQEKTGVLERIARLLGNVGSPYPEERVELTKRWNNQGEGSVGTGVAGPEGQLEGAGSRADLQGATCVRAPESYPYERCAKQGAKIAPVPVKGDAGNGKKRPPCGEHEAVGRRDGLRVGESHRRPLPGYPG